MKRLELLRRLGGYSQEELSAGSRVGRSRISEIECGRLIPRQGSMELRKLAAFLAVPLSDAHTLLDEVDIDG